MLQPILLHHVPKDSAAFKDPSKDPMKVVPSKQTVYVAQTELHTQTTPTFKDEPMKVKTTDEKADFVQKAKDKTQMHSHKGTYRMRAWLVPEQQPAKGPRPFGRPGM